MRVSSRLVAGFGLLILLFAGVVAYNVSVLGELLESNRRLTRISTALNLGGTELQTRLQQMDEFARKFAATGDTAYARRFGGYADGFESSLHELEALASVIGGTVPAQVTRLQDLWTDFRPVADGFSQRRSATPAAVAEAAAPVVRWLDALRVQTLETNDALEGAMGASVESSVDRTRRAERISWITAGAALVLALAVSVGLVNSIVGGLQRLSEGTRRVADGDLDYRLDTGGAPEFSQLAASFNEMTRRLQEADELKRDFFDRVSHDLKGPLSGMLDAHDLLLEETAGPLEEDQVRLLRLSRESGERLGRMIDLLLDLARLDAGVAELEREEVDVARVVRGLVEEYEPRLRKAGVEWELDVPAGGIEAWADPAYLRRAVDNLLKNALEFSPEEGRIGVAVRTADSLPELDEVEPGSDAVSGGGGAEWVEVAVTDEGPGVDEDLRHRIFDRFVRGQGRGSSSGDGLGLGLALCREVATAHGGTITVEQPPGGGSRFRLFLPSRSAT